MPANEIYETVYNIILRGTSTSGHNPSPLSVVIKSFKKKPNTTLFPYVFLFVINYIIMYIRLGFDPVGRFLSGVWGGV